MAAMRREQEPAMKITSTMLLVVLGLMVSTLSAAAQGLLGNAAELEAVPCDLAPTADATAAMRAMLADPSFSAAPGLAENAYDFNVPGGIPGFGPMGAGIPDGRFARAGSE
jgi:hypothetical protein